MTVMIILRSIYCRHQKAHSFKYCHPTLRLLTKHIQEELSHAKSQSKRGTYASYSAKDKARIGNYAALRGGLHLLLRISRMNSLV